jgi:PAS domain S-box-containing protein
MVVASRESIDQACRQLCGEGFHGSVIPMWVYDRKSLAFLIVNEAAIRRYGYSEVEFLSRTILDIRPKDDIARLLRNTVRAHEQSQEIEMWTHFGKDGVSFPVEILSYELLFAGRAAELILARPMRASDESGEAG